MPKKREASWFVLLARAFSVKCLWRKRSPSFGLFWPLTEISGPSLQHFITKWWRNVRVMSKPRSADRPAGGTVSGQHPLHLRLGGSLFTRFPPISWSKGSLQSIGSEGVLHSRISEHQFAVQHVQSQGVHPERVVQGEGVHLKAGDMGKSVGDLLGQTRRRVSCREGELVDMVRL